MNMQQSNKMRDAGGETRDDKPGVLSLFFSFLNTEHRTLNTVFLFTFLLLAALVPRAEAVPQKMLITFGGYAGRSEVLTNFPVLVVFTNNVNNSGFHYGYFASTNGYDLRFGTNSTATTNSLNYEIESWNTNGASYVWVQAPAIPGDGSGAIWVNWGNTNAANQLPCTTNGAVWTNGYVAVWHMTQTNAQDSTTNRYNGASTNNVSAVAYVGTGQSFGPGNTLTFPGLTWQTNLFSVSYWLKPGVLVDYNQVIGALNWSGAWYSHSGNGGTLWSGISDASRFTQSGYWSAGNWAYFTFTDNANACSLLRNGVVLASMTQIAPTTTWGGFRIGNTGLSVNGLIDEVRISSVSRSTNWVWAEYANMASNTVFNSYGAMTALVVPGLPSIRNDPATGITTNSANLNGSLTSTGTSDTAVWVYWGPTDGTTNANLWAYTNFFGSGLTNGTYVTNTSYGTTFAKGTKCYFNFFASNASGGVWAATAGSPSLTTLTNPAVTVFGATRGMETATLNGMLESDGGTATTVFFCWGTNDLPISSTHPWTVVNYGAATNGQSVSTTLTGLTNGARYWYRVYATNGVGTAWSAPTNFVTVRATNVIYAAANATGDGSLESPCSLMEARDVVRLLNATMSGDIVVYLRGGEYALSSAFVLDERDSGANGYRVIYRAYPAERPVLTGARRITGWTLHDATAGVYKASAGTLEFRQLYINGHRAIRARTPNRSNDTDMGPYYRHKGWDTANKAVVVNGFEIADWQNLQQVEFVARYQWHQQNMRIDRYVREGDNARIYFQSPERDNSAFAHFGGVNDPYYFENAYEFLDAEGEWYLDTATDTVYCKPRAGEDLATADVIAPAVERLIQIQGATNPVHDIQIQGLCFEYSTWMGPSSHGLVDYQACLRSGLGDPVFPGAVHVQNAGSVRIEGNVFRHLGGQGVVLYSQTWSNAVVGNLFEDISANGIVVDPTMASSGNSTNDTIAHNYVRWCGRDYAHACGIAATYPAGLVVEHNEVRDCPYTGISVGWGWTDASTALRDNKIRYNDVFRVCQALCDGGGLYTLSRQPGTHVFENWFHEFTRSIWAVGSPVNGIFHDERSSFMTTEHNVFTSIPGGNIRENAAHDITYINNGTQDQSVKDNAGPLPPYDAILGLGDDEPPRIVSVSAGPAAVVILYNEPVEAASGGDPANYSLNNGIAIQKATLASDLVTVTLTTSPLIEGVTNTLTVNNVRDRATVPNTIRANTQRPFIRYGLNGGLLAWWRFDDGSGALAADSSGNSCTGAVTAGAWTAGKINGALEWSGTGGVTMGGPTGTMSAFSVAFWLYPHTRLDYNQGVGKDSNQFMFHTTASGAIYCGITVSDSSRFTPAQLPAGTLALNVWQHFVFTYDQGGCAFYKNGVKLASKNQAQPAVWTGFGAGLVDGAIDDLRIYGRALADVEVQTFMDTAWSAYEAWRQTHFDAAALTQPTISAMAADPDHDGLNNQQEFWAGTDPTNASSCLTITALTSLPASAGGFEIRWQSVAGKTYGVLAATNLMTGFTTLTNGCPSTPTENVYTDSVTGAEQKFYQVEVE